MSTSIARTMLGAAFSCPAPSTMADPGPRAGRWNAPAIVGDDRVLLPVAAMVRQLLFSEHRHETSDGRATRVPRRLVPSAGAAHPVTAHLLTGPSCDLPAGLHSLDPDGGVWQRCGEVTRGAHSPGASVVITARPQRTWARYGLRSAPLLIADAAFTATWIASLASAAGWGVTWARHDRLAEEVGLPTHDEWIHRWPGTAPEIAVARVDITVAPGVAPAVRRGERRASPQIALGHVCHPVPGLTEQLLCPRRQDGGTLTVAATDAAATESRRSAPFGAFRPSPVTAATAQRIGDHARCDDPRVRVETVGPDAAAERGLARLCCGQTWLERAPVVVLWSLPQAELDDADAHWHIALSAARMTLAAHLGTYPGLRRTRVAAGWQTDLPQRPDPGAEEREAVVLALAFAPDEPGGPDDAPPTPVSTPTRTSPRIPRDEEQAR